MAKRINEKMDPFKTHSPLKIRLGENMEKSGKESMKELGLRLAKERKEMEEKEEEKKIDNNVNHPSHYQGKIECIDYLKDKLNDDEFKGFLKGNILKYLSRAGKKDNELQDIKKAKWYLDYLINFTEEK